MHSNIYRDFLQRAANLWVAAFFGLSVIASSCATTINESAPSTVGELNTSVSAQTSTLATVDASLDSSALLEQMLQSVTSLSSAMQKSDRKSAANHLEQISLINVAVRPKILLLSDQLVADYDRVVAFTKSAVERNRPADADKALRFLPLVIDSLKNF